MRTVQDGRRRPSEQTYLLRRNGEKSREERRRSVLWGLLVLLLLLCFAFALWGAISATVNRGTIGTLLDKDMVLMDNVTALSTIGDGFAEKDMVLMANVTALDARIDAEELARIAKDMVLMANVTDLRAAINMLDAETLEEFMIKMANITTLFDLLDAEEAARIAKDMVLMADVTALDGRIDAEEAARIAKDMVLMQNVTDIVALANSKVATVDGVAPDGSGNIDLIASGGITLTPGANSITIGSSGGGAVASVTGGAGITVSPTTGAVVVSSLALPDNVAPYVFGPLLGPVSVSGWQPLGSTTAPPVGNWIVEIDIAITISENPREFYFEFGYCKDTVCAFPEVAIERFRQFFDSTALQTLTAGAALHLNANQPLTVIWQCLAPVPPVNVCQYTSTASAIYFHRVQ